MLYEYTIDPDFLLTISKRKGHQRELNPKEWGIGKNRFHVELPNNDGWAEKVYTIMGSLQGRDADKLQEFACNILSNVSIRRNSDSLDWNDKKSWADNIDAISTSAANFPIRLSFTDSPGNIVPCFSSDDLFFDDDKTLRRFDKLWYSESCSGNAKRNADNLVSFLRVFLCASSAIIWVDPYFSPFNRESIKSLKRVLEEIGENGQIYRKKRKITVYARKNDDINYDAFWNLFDEKISDFIPEGTLLTIIVAKRGTLRKFHNRYMISELGGYAFQEGSDTAKDDIWTISLMNGEEYRKEFDYYSKNCFPGEKKLHLIKVDERNFGG